MRGKYWLLPTGLALLLAATGTARDGKPKKDPPGTAPYLAQLRGLFKSWDLNGDGYLDKEELAKAFRGPNAKPYDYQAPAKDKDKPPVGPPEKAVTKDTENNETSFNKDKGTGSDVAAGDFKVGGADAAANVDRVGPKNDFTAALYKDEGKEPTFPTNGGAAQKTTKPDYSKYPDYNFLMKLDKDGDERISKDEFDAWAHDYAGQLKHQADALKRIAHAEERLAKATKAADQRALQNEIKQEHNALNQLNKDMKAFEKLNQLMKGK
jgi:hypothetical protein